MVFNRRKNPKVQWEKQVTKIRKDSRNQFNQFAHDQRSAVSDLSETIYTNGSEVDAIGGFGQQNNVYVADDAFTLGNGPSEDFEPIGDYEPIGAGVGYPNNKNGLNEPYIMGQFLEDDTLDNTFENQRRGASFFTMSTNDTGLTGDGWGNQGSYHLQGLETTPSDFAEPVTNDTYSTTGQGRRGRGYRQDVSNDDTADTSYIDGDDDTSYRRGRGRIPDEDYDIPQPVRQSPVVALYDAILSHPLLTCMSLPCIPCLALYVKSAERNIPPATRRRPRSKRAAQSEDREDESTFAEYHANQRRFDEISRDESRSDVGSVRGAKPSMRSKIKQGMRKITSKNSEYSAVNSKLGMRSGRPNSRAGTADFSQIQSRGRPISSGMMSGGGQTEFSNIVSKPGRRNLPQQGAALDPNIAYDNFGNHFSLTMDSGDQFMQNVPQGEGNGASVDDTPKIRYSSSNRSVGWKLDNETQSRGTSEEGLSPSYDHVGPNQQFWGKVNDTFSTHTGQGPQSHGSSSFGPVNNRWNRVTDSISNQNRGYGQMNHMGHMVSYDDSANASSRGYDNRYYGQ